MIITGALFAFGLAGIFATLRPLPAPDAVPGRLRWLTVGLAASLLVIRPGLNAIPFHYDLITEQPGFQLLYFLGMYLLITVPFFLAGLIFAWVFATYAKQIQVLYFWDLTGAAVGCVVLIPLLPPVGPGGSLLIAAGLALVAGGLFVPWQRMNWVPMAAAVGLVAAPFLLPGYLEFVEHKSDRGLYFARLEGRSELVRWDPISKIEVIDLDIVKNIIYDGGSQSSFIYPFNGRYLELRDFLEESVRQNFEAGFLRHFWQRGVVASHRLKRGTARRVLVIGSAAGQETKAALTFGAAHVDAVEMVGEVIALGKSEYLEYNGYVLVQPQANVVQGEGRAFLRAAREPYDIIQIFSNHSSSSVAAGAGAMDPTYLLTADAFEEYFEGLNADGILHINHHTFPRIVTTAALGWKNLGRDEFQRHVVVVMRADEPFDTLPTVLIKMVPWTQAEVDSLRALFSIGPEFEARYEVVEDPLHPEQSYLTPEFYSGTLSAELVDRIDYRIVPTTDDRPYFKFLRKRLGMIEQNDARFVRSEEERLLNSQIERGGGLPIDVIHLIVTGATSVIFAGVFIGVPLVFSRVGRTRWPGMASTLVYFSCLGAGFIILELTFIQKFMKFIGYPLYTYSLVLFTLLLAAGIGSLASGWLRVTPRGRWPLPFVGTLVYGVVFLATHGWLFDVAFGLPVAVRMGIAAAYLFPMGFFMGMAFPLGILCVEQHSRSAVAWAWGMNGLFTVIGGLASVLLSIYVGFTVTEMVALGIYAVAFATMARLRAGRTEPA